MSHNSRRALFYVLFLLFLVLGSGIVLFAQGWRMDFPSFRISKVGGIYVRSYPENASTFLNGKPTENQSGFLSRGTLISDLFPKTYYLALTAPGYLDWHENVAVTPSFVANHKYAVLVPANPTSIGTSTVTNFRESQNDILSENSNGEISFDEKVIGFGKLIDATPDLQSVVFQTAKGTYEFANTQTGIIINLSNMLAKAGFNTATPPKIFLSPFTDGIIFAINTEKVEMIDAAQGTSSEIDEARRGQTIANATIAVSPGTVAWVRSGNQMSSSSLLFYDLSSETVASTTISIEGSVKELNWITNSLIGILTENGSFYLYDTDQQNLQKTADDVQSFSATADGSRIATLEVRSLEIFTPKDPEGYYRFNLPDISNAQTLLWYRDDDHLFVSYPDRVAFLDLEDANLTNFTTISLGTWPRYDPQTNALYMLDFQNHLLRFDFAK